MLVGVDDDVDHYARFMNLGIGVTLQASSNWSSKLL